MGYKSDSSMGQSMVSPFWETTYSLYSYYGHYIKYIILKILTVCQFFLDFLYCEYSLELFINTFIILKLIKYNVLNIIYITKQNSREKNAYRGVGTHFKFFKSLHISSVSTKSSDNDFFLITGRSCSDDLPFPRGRSSSKLFSFESRKVFCDERKTWQLSVIFRRWKNWENIKSCSIFTRHQ